MATSFEIHQFADSDFDVLLDMSQKLWHDLKVEDLQRLLSEITTLNNQIIWLAKVNNQAAGFAIFSIRTDYVEGADKSPTGYLEGIFVDEKFRKLGIARKFVQLGEQWCKSKGCSQIGSDTWLTDHESRNFHKQVGFWEEDELVHFLKDIN